MLLRHYLEQGLSKAEIARTIGVSRRTVHHWLLTGQLERDLDEAAVRYRAAGSVRRSDAGASCQKKIAVPAGRGREVIETIRQGLKEDGLAVSVSQLCRWFGVPRRTVYYRPTRKAPTLQQRFVQPIKQMIEEHPAFGYRTVAHLLRFNQNTVQRIFQLMRWQVKKRPVGFRPRVRAMPSVAAAPNERWSTDLCRVWSGLDGWTVLALVMDCHSRELLGWHLSRSGKSKTAEAALEQALTARYGTLGRVPQSFLLRSDNGLVFFYNIRRPHQALGMKTPAEAFALAA